jgi:hypothetical protein
MGRRARLTAATLLCCGVLGACGLHRPFEPGRGDVALSPAEEIACARVIVEGDVLEVSEAPREDHVTVTVGVRDWIKPRDDVREQMRFELWDPIVLDGREHAYDIGTRVVVIDPKGSEHEPRALWDRSLRIFHEDLDDALAKAPHTDCPPVMNDI